MKTQMKWHHLLPEFFFQTEGFSLNGIILIKGTMTNRHFQKAWFPFKIQDPYSKTTNIYVQRGNQGARIITLYSMVKTYESGDKVRDVIRRRANRERESIHFDKSYLAAFQFISCLLLGWEYAVETTVASYVAVEKRYHMARRRRWVRSRNLEKSTEKEDKVNLVIFSSRLFSFNLILALNRD